MSQPNILFIVADQWRADCIASNGHPAVKTPSLDALAKDSTVFCRHFAQAVPCSPSRASLYTGMYQSGHRVLVNGSPLDNRHTNFARELRKAGYEPAVFGYTDTALDPRTLVPGDPALHTYEAFLPGTLPVVRVESEKANDWIKWLDRQGLPVDFAKPTTVFGSGPPDAAGGPTPVFSAEQTVAAFLTDEVVSYIKTKPEGGWCVHLSVFTPHPPFIVPPPFSTMYGSAADKLPFIPSVQTGSGKADLMLKLYRTHCDEPETAADFYPGLTGLSDLTEKDFAMLRRMYFGQITETDEKIGRLIRYLKQQGLYDNTHIVFTSDHGDLMGDHGLLGKLGYFDEAAAVPLMIKPAGSKTGRKVFNFSESVDIFPTLLDLVGLDIPRQCDGNSLRPYLPEYGQSQAPQKPYVVWEYCYSDLWRADIAEPFAMSAEDCFISVLRDDRFKLVHFNGIGTALFNLITDPHCLNDIAEVPEYATEKFAYLSKLFEWRMRQNERTLTHYCHKL